MTEPKWKFENDLKLVVSISLPTSPPVILKMDASAVDDLLRTLGDLRALMQPEVPRSFAVGQKVEAVPNPIWVTEPDALLGDSLVHVRDPRYGWLHYIIPRDEARKLGRHLQSQADFPPPGSRDGKLN